MYRPYDRVHLLLLFASALCCVTCCVHDGAQARVRVRQAPQNYSSHHVNERTRSIGQQKWMDIRVFADTNMIMDDFESTCYKVGKYVRVGMPPGKPGTGGPVCSSVISYDCWKLCSENDVLTREKASFIADMLIPTAVNWLISTVKVSRVVGSVRIPPEAKPEGCADHLTLPTHYYKPGISNADLILIVTGRPTLDRTVAWAVECAADQTGRPIFGHINIGPDSLEPNFKLRVDHYSRMVIHELTHVLGFNSDKFPFYKDPSGNPYPSVTSSQYVNGKKIEKIITPKAVAAARAHFGCDALDGVPLEDGGDESTRRSHWEKRIFRNEYMTGSYDGTSVISDITLALLEDSGWYKTDHSQAEFLEWGSSMGCNFVNGPCSKWKAREGYFCNNQQAQGCTSDRKAIGYCNLMRHPFLLPSSDRHFPDGVVGGSDELADHCPYFTPFSNGVCTDPGNQQSSTLYGEHYGENSKCFESSLVKDGFRNRPSPVPMCYDYRCVSSSSLSLEVQVGSEWYPCPFEEKIEGIPGFTGVLRCPNASFCQAPGVKMIRTNPKAATATSPHTRNEPSHKNPTQPHPASEPSNPNSAASVLANYHHFLATCLTSLTILLLL